ncbi:transglycosylase domain-containing protein [Amphibacillus sp. Q70]|uniref:transglycosylase domain-containing protein n=1 Tax=Amphibacillus sp. Q70 TaxID=3453416 RepID=UPI003F87B1F4
MSDTAYHRPRSRIQKRKQAKRKGKAGKVRRLVKFICIILVLSLAGFAAIIATGQLMIDESEIKNLQYPDSTNSTQEYVMIDDMPDYVWEAFIAIEDHRYMSHVGVDPIGFSRAMWENVKAWDFAEGGSTITMQLSRNLFLTQDKTIVRKLKEMVIALNMELEYSKEELLGMYLNSIYFGHGTFGIEQASNFYFGKTVRSDNPNKDTINLSEAAMLAGLLKAPEYYSPNKYPEKAKQRQDIVLFRMNELGMISEDEMKAAVDEDL